MDAKQPLKKLTERELRFVEAYLLDPNGTKAAVAAGYSAKTAKSIAEQLMKRPHVAAKLAADRAAREKRTGVSADSLLLDIDRAPRADVGDLFGSDGQLLPVKSWPEAWRSGPGRVAGVDVVQQAKMVGRGKQRKRVVMSTVAKIRLGDPAKLAELIGRHTNIRAWRDQFEVSVPRVTSRDLTGRKDTSGQ